LARKRCCGIIDKTPCCHRFLPEGKSDFDTVKVLYEELEAIRLRDIDGLDQTACAALMGLSRATFQRVLRSARIKVATALLEGNQIIFERGNYSMRNRTFECVDCGKTWEEQPCAAGGQHGYQIACPKCGSMKKSKIEEDGSKSACSERQHFGGCCGGRHHG
jgi:predicted DNA-binding protein (UPF0251 family)